MDSHYIKTGRYLKMDPNMYDTDDFKAPEPKLNEPTIISTDKGMTTEIDVMGKKFDIINPDYVRSLQQNLLDVRIKLRTMTQNFNTLNATVKKLVNRANELQTQLARKIDRD